MSVTDPLNYITAVKYDPAGRKKIVTQPNGQTITYDSYDEMNRPLQQTVKQTPSPDAVTKYTYYPSGLLETMKDPRLVARNSPEKYSYAYDLMGRKQSATYPPAVDGGTAAKSESFTYDLAGRLWTFKNRDGKTQTFSYDALHRQTGFQWDDGGVTPDVSFGYDVASRMTSITNANAVIKNVYFDDNMLKSQEEWATADASNHRTVTYAYDADGNRGNIIYPSEKNYSYGYNGRNDLWHVRDNISGIYQAAYVQDLNGNVTTRSVGDNGIVTDASQRDAMGRIEHLEHRFTGTTRSFDYGYNAMGSRTSIQRDGGSAEIYGYDLAQQVTTGVESGSAATYGYDANGNRTLLNGGGTYATNNLSQQTTFNGQAVGHDVKGNVSASGSAASYVYDAQNRLQTVTSGGVTTTFKYDGLNRKISQTEGSTTTYNVWDGWNLIEERGAGNALLNTYLYGGGEIIKRMTPTNAYFYFQDALGSTTHVSNLAGNLLESYKYDTFGRHKVYGPAGVERTNGSGYDVRHLFTGQLWMPQTGLYDYRNRVYSPTLTRFLQPDPIGFGGDPGNLYRYCGGDSVNNVDPFGLETKKQSEATAESVTVTGSAIPGAVAGLTSQGGPAGGWTTATGANGGIDTLTVGGGGGGFRFTSGGSTYTGTYTRDSNQLGTTPSQPFASSTQGWWTNPDGFATGSSWVMNLQVQTAIEGPPQAGIKSLQSLTFNSWGQIVSHWGSVGTTDFGLFGKFYGRGNFSATVWSAGGRYLANMTGSAQTFAGLPPIDYSFNFGGNFGGGSPTVSGAHDGYPSYTVWANGQQVYYRHETGWPSALRPPMEIVVGD